MLIGKILNLEFMLCWYYQYNEVSQYDQLKPWIYVLFYSVVAVH